MTIEARYAAVRRRERRASFGLPAPLVALVELVCADARSPLVKYARARRLIGFSFEWL